MIKHIVFFKLQASEQKHAQMQEIKKQLEALIPQIPELKSMEVGINANPKEQWDLSLTAIVENWQDLETYANHPAHQSIVKNLISPIKEDRACVDYAF